MLAATADEPASLSVGPHIAGSLLRPETLRKLSGGQNTGIKLILIKISSQLLLLTSSHFSLLQGLSFSLSEPFSPLSIL